MEQETPERVVKRWLHPPADESWKKQAACQEEDPRLWFPGDSQAHGYDAQMGKAICRICPVSLDCLTYAFLIDARHGTYGGLTASERAQMRRLRL